MHFGCQSSCNEYTANIGLRKYRKKFKLKKKYWVTVLTQIVVVQSLSHIQLQQARIPCSLSPRVCSSSCLLSRWCHPIILSPVIPFCLQSFPASGSFPVSQFFTSGGQSIGALASVSVLLVNIQGWFPLGLTVGSCSPKDSYESSPTPQFKSINSLALSLLYGPTLTSIHD